MLLISFVSITNIADSFIYTRFSVWDMKTRVGWAGVPVLGEGDWIDLTPEWLYEAVPSETEEIIPGRLEVETFMTRDNTQRYFNVGMFPSNGRAIIFVNTILYDSSLT